MLGRKKDIIPNRKKNVSTRGKSLRVSVPNKGKQKKASRDRYYETLKVYCQSCAHLVIARRAYECHTDSNKAMKLNIQEWLTPDAGFSLLELPSSKNQRNQCPDYIRKTGRSWSILDKEGKI